MKTNVLLRAATLADCAQAILNRQLIDAEEHRSTMAVPALDARMRDWLANDYRAIVAERGKHLVGYVLARRDDDALYVRQLFVVPAERRRGLGRRLVAAIAADASDALRLRLDVLVHNAPALAFWRSIGFVDYAITLERGRNNARAPELARSAKRCPTPKWKAHRDRIFRHHRSCPLYTVIRIPA